MSRIVLTFKNNDKEKAIEEFLDSKVSPAGYLKEIVWEIMNNGSVTIPVKNDEPKQETVKSKKPKVGGFK